MDEVTAQATGEIPTSPRPEVWPEKWLFQHWYWVSLKSHVDGGVWYCFTSAQYQTEKDAIAAAMQHEREKGGPVRIIRIPGSDAKGGK